MLIIHNSMQSAFRQIYCNASEKKSHGQLGKMPGTWHLTNKWEALLSTNHPSNNISFFSEKKWTNNYLLQILWPFLAQIHLNNIYTPKQNSFFILLLQKEGQKRKDRRNKKEACSKSTGLRTTWFVLSYGFLAQNLS